MALPKKKGLCIFSCMTVVAGPCPGKSRVSSGSVNSFCVTDSKSVDQDELARPIEPAKIESPEKTVPPTL